MLWRQTSSLSTTPTAVRRATMRRGRLHIGAHPIPWAARILSVKITGERVVTPGGGFNPTWQRHVAAYALAEPELGPGRVLDLGCGIGHSFHLLAPRETVGVDLDPGALAGGRGGTVVAGMRARALGGGGWGWGGGGGAGGDGGGAERGV